jgi:PAS domain S-box-containing protein
LTVLIIGDWIVAGRAARQMLEGRMSNAGDMTARSIPFVLETGQNLIISLADDPIFYQSSDQVHEFLAAERPKIPYFSQLIYLDPEGNLVASDPANAVDSPELSRGEIDGIELASLVPIQIISTIPEPGSSAAILSFIAGVRNPDGELQGVIIGRSDLAANPFAKPLLSSIDSLSAIDGEGILIDENGLVLFHPDPNEVMTLYTGSKETIPQFYEATSQDGIRELIYYHPVVGRPWGVVITVPARYVQEQAINIALPLLAIISILSLAAIFIFRFGLRSVTSSLQNLAVEADRMSHGRLDNPLIPGGEDEVGRLSRSFEKMRTSLKSRLDELNRLLFVSQGIASTFDIAESLNPVLESALATGASSARVHLVPAVIPNSEGGIDISQQYGCGPDSENFEFMDEQVTAFAEKQDIVKLSNLTRPRIFTIPGDSIPPRAILAAALRHENLFYGSLWLGFDQPHQFTDEEVRYVVTLAGQAALAAANARLFQTAEIGRQRLEAILTSTPDPVLVTDQNDNLLLTNPAATDAFGLYDGAIIGQPISEVITQQEVLDLIRLAEDNQQSQELIFDDGKTYLATASSVQVEGERVGRVCMLRDVSSFKQLDELKSEFVSTVSHDLRSPLALVQGYTSMLRMVGELNEQQSSYLQKIAFETEKISHLVKNLLDLGRIEAEISLQLESKPVDDVIHRVVADTQLKADQKRVNLLFEIQGNNLPSVEADQALLKQALTNLVENAIKYTESGGDVVISLTTSDTQVAYIVEDTGIGISPADQQNLFEKFTRASKKVSQEDEGSGLGLAIVKSIAEKHGGHVLLESQLGVGSTFSIVIPLEQ